MDMLADGAAWLADQLKQSVASTVVFVRGSTAIEVRATVASSVFDAQNQSGVLERWESRDYVVQTADLPFGHPVRGDKIVETIDEVSTTFDVASPQGMPLWRYGDGFRKTVRIHTVQSDSGVDYITTEDGDILIA